METIVMQAHSSGDADSSEDGVRRPRLLGGDPLGVGARRSFGKPGELVEIDFQGHRPTRVELKLFNVLLAESMRQLAVDPERRSFAARAALLRRAIGQGAGRSNARLRQALERLRSPVRMPRLGNGLLPPLSSWNTLDLEEVSWHFEDPIRALLHRPQIWAWLDLGICAAFQHTASLLLYERLRLIANRDWPVLSIGSAELRGALGLEGRMTRGCDLLQKVVMPAVREVERLCALSISVQPEREPRHGMLTKLTFNLPLDRGKASRPAASGGSALPKLPGNNSEQVQAPDRERAPVQRTARTPSVPATPSASIPISKSSGSSRSLKAALFDRGVEMLTAQGISEGAARSFLGSLMSKYDDGFVVVALDHAWQRREILADFRSWVVKRLKRYPTREDQRLADENRRQEKAAPVRQRPLATPENLGISPGMAAKIQARNRSLKDFNVLEGSKAAAPDGEKAGRESGRPAEAARSTAVDADGGNE
jgi:hypothetical protein